MLGQWCRTFLNLSVLNKNEGLSFFQLPCDTKFKRCIYLYKCNLLINLNPLKKQIWRSITNAIWKQKKTIWTTQVRSNFKLNGRRSVMKHLLGGGAAGGGGVDENCKKVHK